MNNILVRVRQENYQFSTKQGVATRTGSDEQQLARRLTVTNKA